MLERKLNKLVELKFEANFDLLLHDVPRAGVGHKFLAFSSASRPRLLHFVQSDIRLATVKENFSTEVHKFSCAEGGSRTRMKYYFQRFLRPSCLPFHHLGLSIQHPVLYTVRYDAARNI